MRTLLTLAALWLASSGSAQPPTPVILISIDDLRADRLRPDLMPNLGAIAAQSVSFEAAFSQATWTLPSHASLLLSEYVGTHGAGGSSMLSLRAPRPGERNISEVLGGHGYSAGSYASAFFFDPEWGLVEGFSPRTVVPPYADPLPDAADWIVARATAPAFLFAHAYAVHNYQDSLDAAKNADGSWRCPISVDRNFAGDNLLTSQEPTCVRVLEDYDRAAHCFDLQLGAFKARLQAAGVWDRAVVAIVSDHGESLCDGAAPGARWRHALAAYEEQIHVPWLLKLPHDRFAGRRGGGPGGGGDRAPAAVWAPGVAAPHGNPRPRRQGQGRGGT
ncbi:MAG: sulfatase-like hydrolase/transferase, partial [Elusimicrobiota bacterium]